MSQSKTESASYPRYKLIGFFLGMAVFALILLLPPLWGFAAHWSAGFGHCGADDHLVDY